MNSRFGLWLLSFILVLSCNDRSSETASEIIEKSINAHGGWTAYKSLPKIAFNKTTRLYNKDGFFESENWQLQHFQFSPTYQATISWHEEGVFQCLSFDDEEFTFTGDSLKYNLAAHLKAASFVFFQPFVLNDSLPTLLYEGDRAIMDSIIAKEVKVVYPNSLDTWWFYFDQQYRCVANKVLHNGRYSFIENLEFQEYKGLVFNKHRKSYFVDSLGKKKYLRAEYYYHLQLDSL